MSATRSVLLLGVILSAVALPAKAQDSSCGNGRLEPAEQCDDGNLVAGDGCDSTCQVEQQCLDPGNEFSFFVWSDTYPGQETGVRRVLADAVSRTKHPDRVIPRFWVSAGDIPFMEVRSTLLDELNDEISNSATGQKYPFTCTASNGKFPYFAALGNHDVDGNVRTTPPAQYDYWSNFVGPRLPSTLVGISNFLWGPSGAQDARTTYSFDYRNAHVVVLNQYHGDPDYPTTNPIGCVRDDLLQWLEEDLTQTTKPLRFLFGHEPTWPFCSNLGGKGGEYCPVGSQDNQDPPYRPRPYSTTGSWAEAYGVHWGDSLEDARCPAGSRNAYWDLLARHGVIASFNGHTHTYSSRLVEGNGTRRNEVSGYSKSGAQFEGREGVWGVEDGFTHTSAGAAYVLVHVHDNVVTFEAWDQKGTTEPFQLVETWSVVSSQAPQVAIVSPATGSTFVRDSPVQIDAQASDFNGTVTQVAFYAESALVAVDTSSPYSVTWQAAPVGPHVLTAVATNDAGLDATSAAIEITVTAQADNRPPVLSPIEAKTASEKTLLTFTPSASDPDGDTLTFSVVGAPEGVGIDPASGTVTWAPTEAQGPDSYTFAIRVSDSGTPALTAEQTVSVTIQEVNQAPVLAPVPAKTVAQDATLTFTASATDGDLPANKLTYSLVAAPAAATIDPATGVFTWTPGAADAGSRTFSVAVADDGAPPLSGLTSVTVTVTPPSVNRPPVLSPIEAKTVPEGTLLTFTPSASDPDGDTLTFGVAGAPEGVSIDPTSGTVAWTPTEAQGPDSYTFAIRVSDSGTPALTAEQTVSVTIQEVNQAPVLAPVPAKTVAQDATLTFTASATDGDLPANRLTYSLVAAPAAATIDPATGVFTWTPGAADAGSRTFSVAVADDGAPPLSGLTSVTVTVTARPDLIVTAIGSSSTSALLGGPLSLSSTVANVGGAASDAFVTFFSLSRDSVYGGNDDTPFTSVRSISSLAAGATSAGATTVTVPVATPIGSYFLCVYADAAGAVPEGNEANNTLCSQSAITVTAPDLRVTTVSMNASTAVPGDRIKTSYSVLNAGGWKTDPWSTVAFAFSRDPIWSSDDRVFAAQGSFGPLAAGATATGKLDLIVPADIVQGSYYVCAFADATTVVLESDETNNWLCTDSRVDVQTPPAGIDLVLTVVSPKATTVALGGTISVSSSVKNVGNGAAGAFATYFSLSRDGVYGGGDDVPLAETRSIASLAAGATSSGSIALAIPTAIPIGSYYVCAYVDGANAVAEANEANNSLCSALAVAVSAPDLRLSALSPLPTTVARGARLSTSYAVVNDGTLKTQAWTYVAFALSADASWNDDDRRFATTGSFGPLAAGATYSTTLNLTVTPDTQPGLYYVCALADSGAVIPESNEGNNSSCSVGQIEVR